MVLQDFENLSTCLDIDISIAIAIYTDTVLDIDTDFLVSLCFPFKNKTKHIIVNKRELPTKRVIHHL